MRTGALCAATVGLLLAGCGAGGGAGAPPGATDVDEQTCSRLLAVTPDPAAPTMFMVVDHTASGVRRALSPAGVQMITEAQSAGAALTILAVEGDGAPPREVIVRLALDPAPGAQAATAVRARAMITDCVSLWVGRPTADPTRPGSDLLSAVDEALRQRPRWLLVSSDGVSTAGQLNLNTVGIDVDPDPLIRQLDGQIARTGPGTSVTWTGMGETTTALPESSRTDLRTLWTAVLQKAGVPAEAIDVDAASGAMVDGHGGLPADEIRIPQVSTVVLPDRRVFDIPEPLLFSPGRADLVTDSAAVLAPVIEALRGGGTATIVGHSADFGTPAYQHDLSLARAQAIRARLAAAGIGVDRVSVDGVGSTQPAAPEWHGTTHDLAAAALNRRVVITLRDDR